MSKKLNNFIPKSTHFVVDEKGELKFLTICPKLNKETAEFYLLGQSNRLYEAFGIRGALEYFNDLF